MIIRKANINDAEGILHIRNHEKIRILSIKDQNEITFEKHILWFTKKLENKNDLFFVIDSNNIIEGYCRLDCIEDRKYVVSIAINPDIISKGLGSKLLIEALKSLNNGNIVIAEILDTNIISQNFFKKFGFVVKEKGVYELILDND